MMYSRELVINGRDGLTFAGTVSLEMRVLINLHVLHGMWYII